jgi:hypothetical protein
VVVVRLLLLPLLLPLLLLLPLPPPPLSPLLLLLPAQNTQLQGAAGPREVLHPVLPDTRPPWLGRRSAGAMPQANQRIRSLRFSSRVHISRFLNRFLKCLRSV